MSSINPIISVSSSLSMDSAIQSKIFMFNETFNTSGVGTDVSIPIDIPKTFYLKVNEIKASFNYALKSTGEFLTNYYDFAGYFILTIANQSDNHTLNSFEFPIQQNYKYTTDNIILNGDSISGIYLKINNADFLMKYNNVINIGATISSITMSFLFDINFYSKQKYKLVNNKFIYYDNNRPNTKPDN